jgi:L-lactate dehydrogenase complex protein LldG
MSDRDAILGQVRAALAGRETTEHPGTFEGWRPSALAGDSVDGFRTMFEAAGGETERFATEPEAAAWVRAFVGDYEKVSIGKVARWPLHNGAAPGERIEGVDPADAEVGVSWAYGAIAETGSLIMIPLDGRRAQLLPPVHLVFVEEQNVFATLREALTAMKDKLPDELGGAGDFGVTWLDAEEKPAIKPGSDPVASLPSAIGLHSGPSKSADIGQVLVRGVHGPGRVIAVLVGRG